MSPNDTKFNPDGIAPQLFYTNSNTQYQKHVGDAKKTVVHYYIYGGPVLSYKLFGKKYKVLLSMSPLMI